jgi:sulfide:quinone oxidoreductase
LTLLRTLKRRIEFVEAEVQDVLPESNEVKTSKGKYDYDYLFVALGGSYEETFNAIPGHEHAFMHHVLEGFLGLRDSLNSAEDGVKVFVGNHTENPIEGPSYQVVLIAEYLLRKRGIKGEIYLSTQSPNGVFGQIPAKWVSDTANKYFEKRGVKVLKGKGVKEIKKDKVVLNNGTEVEADIKSVLPKLSASSFLRKSGLVEGNFADVELPTFRHKKFSNIYVFGDSAKGMVPAKTARGAMISAENAVSDFVKQKKGLDLPFYSQGILCMMIAGDDDGLLRFDREGDKTRLTFTFGRIFVQLKKTYSAMLVRRAFDVPYHAAPLLSH